MSEGGEHGLIRMLQRRPRLQMGTTSPLTLSGSCCSSGRLLMFHRLCCLILWNLPLDIPSNSYSVYNWPLHSTFLKFQVLVSRPHPGTGTQVHQWDDGGEVCRGGDPGPGEDLGRVWLPNPPHLLPVDGVRPNQQYRGSGQKAKAGVPCHLNGSRAGSACKEASSTEHERCEWINWERENTLETLMVVVKWWKIEVFAKCDALNACIPTPAHTLAHTHTF